MCDCWYENNPFSISQRCSSKSTNRAAEEIFVLVQLYNMISWSRMGQDRIPRYRVLRTVMTGMF